MTTAGYVSYDVFLPDILQYCQGAPSIQARMHIVDTIINFCERTFVLKKEPSTLTVEEDVYLYTLKYASDKYRTIDIIEARFGEISDKNLPLSVTTEADMDSRSYSWRTDTGSKPSIIVLLEETNKVRLYPIPSADVDDDLYLRTRVTYKRDQVEFDEFIYEKWFEAIVSGTIGRMLTIKNASWYDPRLAGGFALEYSRAVKRARKESVSGVGTQPGKVNPQSYYGHGQALGGSASIWSND